MARTEGSGWGGGPLLYQPCPHCGKKKAYFKPMMDMYDVPPFKCTSCKERFRSDILIRKTYAEVNLVVKK